MTLPKQFNSSEFEDQLYNEWLEAGQFKPEINPDGKPYTIVLPPPNATGTLHLGHATMLAIQDLLIRYHRMQGDAALWVPGTDHAAIATQSKVEGILKKEEGKSRHDLGREAFLDRVKAFVADSQSTIRSQVKKMGASIDWSRETYTMDATRDRAVKEVFAKMYKDGLIYRGHRIVNWDPIGHTTVADDEMDYKEETTNFYTFKYGPFEISTARPETKFGDKYVVMHPDDQRYAEYSHGQEIEVEWINGPITATIIKDEAADPEFGTGVMTITPWHSVIDFEIAERHNLAKEQVIDLDGKLLPIAGEFAGMDIKEARKKIVQKMDEKGLLVSVDEKYKHNIARGDRFKGIIEPQIMEQWFIDVNKQAFEWKGKPSSLKAMLQDMVRSGDVDIIPDRFEKTYFAWIDNLRDWCISRQIWWGHRIPVWYKQKLDSTDGPEMYVGVQPPEGEGWEQDPDTLDTWFSSALWTWSTLLSDPDNDLTLDEWIKKSPDMRFHPNQVMETGYDIIFFWVARMMLMTGYVLGEKPFETVYLHGLVRDKQGRKMSKSLDNGIDPLDAIDQYGADATRLSLVIGSSPGNDMRIYDEKIAGYRNFVNKIWNIGRYILTTVENPHLVEEAPAPTTISDKWILSRFEQLVGSTSSHLDQFNFSAAGENLYQFTWSELADWYVEDAKVEQGKDEILLYILTHLLRLWHPYMPYVSEVLYKQLQPDHSLIIASWPHANESLINQEAEASYALYQEALTAIRNARAEFNLGHTNTLSVELSWNNNEMQDLLAQRAKVAFKDTVSDTSVLYTLSGGATLRIDLEGLIDMEKEQARLQEALKEAQSFMAAQEKKLANEQFVQNAPEAIVQGEKDKLNEWQQKAQAIQAQLEALS